LFINFADKVELAMVFFDELAAQAIVRYLNFEDVDSSSSFLPMLEHVGCRRVATKSLACRSAGLFP